MPKFINGALGYLKLVVISFFRPFDGYALLKKKSPWPNAIFLIFVAILISALSKMVVGSESFQKEIVNKGSNIGDVSFLSLFFFTLILVFVTTFFCSYVVSKSLEMGGHVGSLEELYSLTLYSVTNIIILLFLSSFVFSVLELVFDQGYLKNVMFGLVFLLSVFWFSSAIKNSFNASKLLSFMIVSTFYIIVYVVRALIVS